MSSSLKELEKLKDLSEGKQKSALDLIEASKNTPAKLKSHKAISLDLHKANKARKKLSTRNKDVKSVRYNKEVCQDILARYANSSMPTFRKFYSRNKQDYWPTVQTFLHWMSEDRDGFGTIKLQLDRVRYTSYVDEIVDIADDDSEDYLYVESVDENGVIGKDFRFDHNGNPIKNAAKLERDKLKIETRFKVMKSMLPDIANRLENNKPESKAEALVDRLANAMEKMGLKTEEERVEKEINPEAK